MSYPHTSIDSNRAFTRHRAYYCGVNGLKKLKCGPWRKTLAEAAADQKNFYFDGHGNPQFLLTNDMALCYNQTMAKQFSILGQYREAKQRHPGMILLFRVGDFYEMYDDDARDGATFFGLTLTTRIERHMEGDIKTDMCGFPHHSLEKYLQKLLVSGRRVAICDQVDELPVGKPVERIVVPGSADDADEELV